MSKSAWVKIALGIVIVVFCFVPLIPISYEVITEKQVTEEYTTVEPYTVKEEIKEPYQSYYDRVIWEGEHKSVPRIEQIPITEYRTITKDVTKYREVTKTRLVYRPVVETQTKLVSLLRYLLR